MNRVSGDRYPNAQDWRQPPPEYRRRDTRLLSYALLGIAVAIAVLLAWVRA